MRKKILIVFLLLTFLFVGNGVFVFATEDKEVERARLEAELKVLEREIAEAEKNVASTAAEKQTLQNRINHLQNEIGYLSSQIQRNRLIIQNLGMEIEDTEDSIYRTTQSIERSKEELGEVLRTMNMERRSSTLEIMLTEDNLSSVFSNLNSLKYLSSEKKEILNEIKNLRFSLRGYKVDLEEDREATQKTAQIQEEQKRQEEAARREQERLYGLTEAEYQAQLAEKKQLEERKKEIEQKLVQLVGIPDVEMPTFQEALEVTKWVQEQTGIRPAFILSIIMQESALGRNVGQCYIADTSSGASRHISTGRHYTNGIHPTRDLPVFLRVVDELGRNPHQTPVSCPMSYGYGGAMGPAQFIPSTWQSVRGSVSRVLGREPDPWKISDSFLASGTLLRNLGGTGNERRAALQYFAGGNWQAPHVQFYGDQTMERTACIQTFIDHGTMTPRCSSIVFMP